VAKYRRDDRFAGKPSYGNMYSVLNAISGHYNSFGPEAPIPKKRLERINKELSDAEKLLSRNR
jgi:photosystem II Psb27 protein